MIKKITICIYIVLIVILGTATVVEAYRGTEFVESCIYHAVYFCVLWGTLSFLSVIALVKFKLWKRFWAFLLHVSFLTILLGALTTFVNGQKGYIHLRTGLETNFIKLRENHKQVMLPFAVRLDSFKVEYYPGTRAPKDYVSYISCRDEQTRTLSQARISMNKIWIAQGYRFYQTSFDKDSKGSFLTVNYDPWGTGITYSGYVLLALSMVGILCSKNGRFRKLLRSQLNAAKVVEGHDVATEVATPKVAELEDTVIKEKIPHESISLKVIMFLLIMCTGFSNLSAKDITELPALNRRQADSLSAQQVIYNDRVTPFNTLAKNFVLKLYGEASYKGLTPEQVIGGWILSPNIWRNEPIIYVKSPQVCKLLHLKSSYAALTDLFDGNTYLLQTHYGKGNQKLDQGIWEVDEKVGLISMLLQGTLIRPIASEPGVTPLSERRVHAELIYNKIPFCKFLFMLNLTIGLLGLGYLFYVYLRKNEKGRFDKVASKAMNGLLYIITLVHSFSYGLHWYIAGHIPLGNGYETMIFMALVILIFACVMHHKYQFITPFGLLLSGFTLLVAYLGQNNPQITPLMPVLLSPWLSSHVSLIMISYALFAFILLDGILALSLIYANGRQQEPSGAYVSKVNQLTVLSEILLYPAVFCLGIGIFLGAVWANESWGRYWAWDPKEVWALITFMVYGAALHMQSVGAFRRPVFFHWYLVLSFLTVLMTYFGVNYILGGMHSYA